jgi:hypothetical protein
MPDNERLTAYLQLEACLLSGQVSDPALAEMMREDAELAAWLRERAQEREQLAQRRRSAQGTPMAPVPEPADIDLVALAAWLRRQALTAETLASKPGAEQAGKDAAARLMRASEVVKGAADRNRHQRRSNAKRAAANER